MNIRAFKISKRDIKNIYSEPSIECRRNQRLNSRRRGIGRVFLKVINKNVRG